jgi:hypothetical protein
MTDEKRPVSYLRFQQDAQHKKNLSMTRDIWLIGEVWIKRKKPDTRMTLVELIETLGKRVGTLVFFKNIFEHYAHLAWYRYYECSKADGARYIRLPWFVKPPTTG